MNKLVINESERNRILKLHQNNVISESVVITDWLSPDERYCIFLDELYDIKKKIKIGNVFENFDHFIFFIKHCYETAEHLNEELKKTLLESVNSIVITESNHNITGLKPYIKQMIQEWTANPFDKEFYSGKNWSDAFEAGKEAVKSGWEGLKKTYSHIKDGEWKQAFSIIAKGALYVARKIRSAMYNPVIMILDAVLLATGVGKGFQFVPWAIVVMLDIYEFVTGDFEDKTLSMGWRLFYFGIDIMGMVTAGAVAKSANTALGRLLNKFGKSDASIKLALKESPYMKTIGEKILNATTGASNILQKALNYLQKNSPMIYKFFASIISGFNRFLNMLINFLKRILDIGGKTLNAPGTLVQKIAPSSWKNTKKLVGLQTAANVGAPMAAIHGYSAYKQGAQASELEKALLNSKIKADYSDIKW